LRNEKIGFDSAFKESQRATLFVIFVKQNFVVMNDIFLKNKILRCLNEQIDNSYCTDESISRFCKISKRRASKLLEQIRLDFYCNGEKSGITIKYFKNEDTERFYRRGGYITKAISDSIFKKPLIREVIVATIAAIISFIGSRQLLKYQMQSQNLKDLQQDSIIKVSRDSINILQQKVLHLEQKK
jgi:hypothetical protein